MRRSAPVALLIAAAFGAAAAATTAATATSLTELPWAQVVVGASIATFGGSGATLGRFLAAEYAGTRFLWKWEMARDVCVGGTVGAGTFFAGSAGQISAEVLALALLIGGYLGARLLGAAAERMLEVVRGAPL